MDKITEELNDLVNMYSWSWKFIKHIECFSKNHKDWFNKKYNGFWPISETSIEVLNWILELLKFSNRKKWQWYYWEQYLLIINTIPFLYGAYKNIIDWFYLQSSINLRWAFESLMRLYFISFHSSDFNLIFWHEAKKQLKKNWKIIKDYPQFNITSFISDELKIPEWLSIYNILSNESHSNMISIFHDMDKIEKWDYDIFVDMKWKIDIEYNIKKFFMIIYAFLRYINDVLIKNTIFDNPELEEQKDEFFKTKDKLMDILEKTIWEKHTQEIDEIMKTIKSY